jgi:hypothetical protein
VPDDEPHVGARTVDLACAYGRYVYRRGTGLLRVEGLAVNHKRVMQLWRRDGAVTLASCSGDGGWIPAAG